MKLWLHSLLRSLVVNQTTIPLTHSVFRNSLGCLQILCQPIAYCKKLNRCKSCCISPWILTKIASPRTYDFNGDTRQPTKCTQASNLRHSIISPSEHFVNSTFKLQTRITLKQRKICKNRWQIHGQHHSWSNTYKTTASAERKCRGPPQPYLHHNAKFRDRHGDFSVGHWTKACQHFSFREIHKIVSVLTLRKLQETPNR